jgi:hypothetical protein
MATSKDDEGVINATRSHPRPNRAQRRPKRPLRPKLKPTLHHYLEGKQESNHMVKPSSSVLRLNGAEPWAGEVLGGQRLNVQSGRLSWMPAMRTYSSSSKRQKRAPEEREGNYSCSQDTGILKEEKDNQRNLHQYYLAHEIPHPRSVWNLFINFLLLVVDNEQFDYSAARLWLRRAVKAGSAEGCYQLGNLHTLMKTTKACSAITLLSKFIALVNAVIVQHLCILTGSGWHGMRPALLNL